jgi:hypothetical protein
MASQAGSRAMKEMVFKRKTEGVAVTLGKATLCHE